MGGNNRQQRYTFTWGQWVAMRDELRRRPFSPAEETRELEKRLAKVAKVGRRCITLGVIETAREAAERGYVIDAEIPVQSDV